MLLTSALPGSCRGQRSTGDDYTTNRARLHQPLPKLDRYGPLILGRTPISMSRAGPAARGRANIVAAFYPIIYVRGYAMTKSEVESTFNLGSTRFELSAGSEAKMPVFASPAARSINEEGSQDSFARFVEPGIRPIADSVADTRDELKYDYRWSRENEEHSGVVAGALFFDLRAGATRHREGGCVGVRFDEKE